ncbi:hypothetical protein JOQ06_023472 [Pogonophryne albipinna]|uniref:Uncharacterized protein n=1 Tax=Pogonophryne albipinna TaxID=1090488 RepID=A0AAD6BMJ8_9TELE|nr:hypothetical protein JOQ06_023472 [Pogonophryne albipinna]
MSSSHCDQHLVSQRFPSRRSQQQQDRAGLPELQSVLALYGPEPAVLDMFYFHRDILTIQASGWNKRKAANLEQTLAKRYMKTMQRITEATEDLEKLTVELSLQDDQVQQWVSDVQQWTTAWGYLFKIQEGAR